MYTCAELGSMASPETGQENTNIESEAITNALACSANEILQNNPNHNRTQPKPNGTAGSSISCAQIINGQHH